MSAAENMSPQQLNIRESAVENRLLFLTPLLASSLGS